MKKRIVIFVFIIGMLSLSNHAFGQLSASYQYSSLNKIGLGYNFSKKVWTELRIYSNTLMNDFTPEIALFYNVSMKDRHEIYVGIGGTYNYFNGVVVPIGLQFRPIENFRRFSIQIEFEPIIDFDRQDII